MGDPGVDLSALVVNYNTTRLCLDMLRSLAAQEPRAADGRPLRIEFVFVDNASPIRDEAAFAKIEEMAGGGQLPGTVILHEENSGYARGMNLAYSRAGGRRVLVLNPDMVFLEGCIERLWRFLDAHPEAGAVGPAGYWERGREVLLPPNVLPTLGDLWRCTLAHAFPAANRAYMARRLAEALPVYRAKGPVSLEMLSGACLMLDRSTIEEIGGLFDPNFPLYYEDTDLFRRIRATGKELFYLPDAHLAHFYNRSGTTNPKEAMRRYHMARAYYYGKWYGPLGTLSESLCRAFLRTRFATRARRKMEARVRDLGDVTEPPVLEFGRRCDRFILEMCQDAAFLLAAAIFGSGDRWSPGPSFWEAFGESEYFFRALSLDGSEPEEIGVFRFRRVPSAQEESVAARGRAGVAAEV